MTGIGIAFFTCFVGMASPGPANIAIISVALRHGQSAALTTAMGVVTGSVMWGLVSAFGLSALLMAWPTLLHVLSLAGGLYLCWIAWRAFRSAQTNQHETTASVVSTKRNKEFYLFGLGLHLTNPKAMFVWMAIIALGMPEANTGLRLPLLIVLGCGLMGLLVFGSYALVFSRSAVMQSYFKVSRTINFLVAAFFTAAGLGLVYRSAMSLLAI